ncbi:MAG: PAS domain S-box protein, partial [Anaerolineales bacterium]
GAIVDANPAACDFYGWTKEELLKMTIQQINTLPTDKVQHEMEQARAQKRRYFVFRHRLANGRIRDVEVFSGPIQFSGKTYLYSIVHDITQRKEIEQKAAQQLEELQRWYAVTLHRENRILELKNEVNFILEQFGLPPRYQVNQENQSDE